MKNQNLLFKSLLILTVLNLIHLSVRAQYCVPPHSIACSAASNLNDFSITGTSLSNLGTGCTSTTAQAYTIYAPSATTTATLLFGQSYTFNATITGSLSISMWIDYDHSNTFDASEWTQISAGATSGVSNSVSVTIPITSVAGPTGLRIRTRASASPNGAPDACLTFGSGETEDYTVTLDPGIPCSGAPTAGTTSSNDTTVCPNVPFNLSLTGSTIASGLTYQWESSLNNTNWTAISGATFIGYQATQSVNTYYRCIVTCNGLSATSAPLLITTNTFINCYCTSTTTSATGSDIGNVTFATLNNGVAGAATNNPNSTNLYTDFTSIPATPITQGATIPIAITQINSGAFSINFATVHIDFNQDGIFDPITETSAIGASNSAVGGNIINGNILVPFTALPGQTRMRIILRAGGSATQSACGTYPTGETEDYLVNVLAGTVCTAPPTAGTASSSFASICGGGSVTISLNGNSIGAGQTYQWQSSPNNSTWGNISNTTTFFNTIITANIFYRCVVTCNGLSDTSTVASVALNPATLCYCVTGLGGGNCGGNLITTVEISGTTLNSVSADTCTFTTGNTLTVYPPSGSTTASLIQGIPYNLNVSLSASSIVSVWIDFNQDGTYSASEWTQVAVTSTVGTPNTIQITVPFNSGLGLTGMRVRSRAVGNINGAPDACTNFGSGETEDYVITLVANVACSGAPTAGIANASISPVCPNITFSLSLTGSTLASGLSYQWQSSVNNTIWTDITGATSFSYSTAQTTDTYYRCIVSCSSASDTSSFVFVPINSFFNCYCNSGANFTTLADIGNVTFGVLSNGVASPSLQNSSAVNTYTDFTSLPPFNYIQSLTYPISITQISQTTFTASAGAVFIDYDHDGNFDPTTEEVLTGNTNAASFTISGNVTIPATALTGVTRMRVVLAQGTTPASPCGTYTFGETEDYLISILSPNSCVMPFIAGFAKSSTNLVCPSDNFTLSIDSLPPDTGFSFQWQRSLDSINWSAIPGATIQVYIGSQNFDSWYRCNVSCNGGTSVSSTSIKVINKPVTQCNYCNTTLGGNCSTNYYIDSLAIGGTTFNNAATGCAANAGFAYSKYPIGGNTTASLARGNYYDLYVKTAGSCNISVWLDYDQSGTFDSTEWIQVSQATDSAVSARVPLVIPAIGLSKLGTTGLRVRSRKAGNLNLGSDGCSPYGSGETEDYYVTLVDAISTGKELENDKNVKVYPNPSTGMLSIECKLGDTKTLQINIMSAGGRLIFAENNVNFKGTYKQTLDLTGFPKGIYFIQFISDKQVMNKKIVLN